MLRAVSTLVILSMIPLAAGPAAWCASPGGHSASGTSGQPTFLDPSKIPGRPTAPPALAIRTPSDTFLCNRVFIVDGKPLPCDSQLQFDGENLRPILLGVPGAINELNTYQDNRRKVQSLAYVGSAGLLMAALGYLFSRVHDDPSNPNLRIVVRNIGLIGGLTLVGGSFIYGFSTLRANEEHLGTAVKLYNEARPNRPIELQFTTGISF